RSRLLSALVLAVALALASVGCASETTQRSESTVSTSPTDSTGAQDRASLGDVGQLPASARNQLHVVSATAPADAPNVDATWLRIEPGDGTSQLVAVLRPTGGARPFPVLLTLHGGSGIGGGVVDHAARLAHAGFVVVTGCYLPDSWDASASPSWCPHPPDVLV